MLGLDLKNTQIKTKYQKWKSDQICVGLQFTTTMAMLSSLTTFASFGKSTLQQGCKNTVTWLHHVTKVYVHDQNSLHAPDKEISQLYEDQSQQVLQLDLQKKVTTG